jgi:hypothetical protein
MSSDNHKRKKTANYFEEFLIIGVSQETIDSDTLLNENAFKRGEGIILPP